MIRTLANLPQHRLTKIPPVRLPVEMSNIGVRGSHCLGMLSQPLEICRLPRYLKRRSSSDKQRRLSGGVMMEIEGTFTVKKSA